MIRLGIQEGSFRADIDEESTAAALMAQIKGIGLHAMTGILKRKKTQQSVSEIARQAEHWFA